MVFEGGTSGPAPPPLQTGEVYVVHFFQGGKQSVVVERELNILSLGEAREKLPQRTQAICEELLR